MLYKGKGPRNLPQNQRFIMLISFGPACGCQNCCKEAHESCGKQSAHCPRAIRVPIETLSVGSCLGIDVMN